MVSRARKKLVTTNTTVYGQMLPPASTSTYAYTDVNPNPFPPSPLLTQMFLHGGGSSDLDSNDLREEEMKERNTETVAVVAGIQKNAATEAVTSDRQKGN